MKLILLACVLIAFAGPGCSQGLSPRNALADIGTVAIELCIRRFGESQAERPFPPEVDRAYVHVSGDVFAVTFTRGELGTFGNRSDNFRTFLSCGLVQNNAKFEILYLGSLLEPPFVDSDDLDLVFGHFYERDVIEALFLRYGDEFQFKAMQDFTLPILNEDPSSAKSLDY